ncbi:hypothetical protein GCM10008956_11530 [Deinococcus arenae]|uniref:Uncharacterized protein n=1 Tax=Deinococcus arenae TaxID=1452751 RepID=A0A8H9GN12_9DEIO|nr:hypothetical protein GCM10008956_11530 [Deinococcus arenae]
MLGVPDAVVPALLGGLGQVDGGAQGVAGPLAKGHGDWIENAQVYRHASSSGFSGPRRGLREGCRG